MSRRPQCEINAGMVLEHADLLSGYKSLTSLPVIMPAHIRDALIYLMHRTDLQNELERFE